MRKYIVFDVDRTIVDSFLPEILSLGEAIKNVTGKILTEEEKNEFMFLTTNTFFDNLGITDETKKIIIKEWDILFKNYQTVCFNGIKDVIKELNNQGYILSIITSRTNDEFHELDDELKDIIDYFKLIVTSDIVSSHKPNKDSMDYLCNELGCTSDDVIYIGDSIVDKEFAINSNCLFIPACWENKELENEVMAISNPSDLINIISKINNKKNSRLI